MKARLEASGTDGQVCSGEIADIDQLSGLQDQSLEFVWDIEDSSGESSGCDLLA
jgi:hypothetical protein